MFVKKVFQLVKSFLANLHYTIGVVTVREWSKIPLCIQTPNCRSLQTSHPPFQIGIFGATISYKIIYISSSEQPIDVFGLVSAYLWGVSAATYLPFVHKDLAPNVFIIIWPPGHCYRRLLSCHSVILHPPHPPGVIPVPLSFPIVPCTLGLFRHFYSSPFVHFVILSPPPSVIPSPLPSPFRLLTHHLSVIPTPLSFPIVPCSHLTHSLSVIPSPLSFPIVPCSHLTTSPKCHSVIPIIAIPPPSFPLVVLLSSYPFP
jgi:hypothetical protein